jgi:hypothetical protein
VLKAGQECRRTARPPCPRLATQELDLRRFFGAQPSPPVGDHTARGKVRSQERVAAQAAMGRRARPKDTLPHASPSRREPDCVGHNGLPPNQKVLSIQRRGAETVLPLMHSLSPLVVSPHAWLR